MTTTRLIDPLVEQRLRTHGAVAIQGPKASGKTTTGEQFAASAVRLDMSPAALASAEADPRLVLDGPTPRLIDEFQLVPGVWNAVRHEVDRRRAKGQFILTGSATPDDDIATHTGARRIARLTMRTMTLSERGLGVPSLSIAALLDGNATTAPSPDFSVADAAEAIVVGGWPDNLGLGPDDALDANIDYLDVIAEVDVVRLDGVRRNPASIGRLLRSYARNTATPASIASLARTDEVELSDASFRSYLDAVRRLFLIEDQEAWKPSLRSRVRLAATPKRHLCDPSLAAAALRCDAGRLLGPEIELLGFLFESLVVHDLRVHSAASRATVRHYRDNKGLEVDAIVEAADGRWIAAEVKLGHTRIDQAAANLHALRTKVASGPDQQCGALVVVVADSPTYVRDDGVVVTSVASLAP